MTDRKNPAKEYLRGVRGVALELALLKQTLYEAREAADAVPSPQRHIADIGRQFDKFEAPDRKSRAKRGDPVQAHAKQKAISDMDSTADRAVLIADTEAATITATARAAREIAETEEMIGCLTSMERMIVREYYFYAHSWSEVCLTLSLSPSRAHAMHADLLAKLNQNSMTRLRIAEAKRQ